MIKFKVTLLILLSTFFNLKCTFGWVEFAPNHKIVESHKEKHLQEKEIQSKICFPVNVPPILSPDDCPESPPPAPEESEYQPWISVSVKSIHNRFYERVFQLILDKGLFYNERNDRRGNPYNFKSPEEIQSLLNFTLGADGESENQIIEYFEKVIEYSPHLSHPYNLHRRASGLDPFGIAADWMEATMSCVMLTYLFSPVFTLMENELFKEVRKQVGYDPVNGNGDGMGTPFSTSYVIELALQRKFPNWKQKGLNGIGSPKMAMFISDQADYSSIKGALFKGLGIESVLRVKSDQNGRMDVNELKKSIENAKSDGRVPFLIIASAGTPILGAIDPMDEISQVVQESDVWYHVEAGCGGALLLSDDKKKMLKGIEKSDSFTWTPHCLLGSPGVMNMLLTKAENQFLPAFGHCAEYAFENTTLYDSKYDLGDKSIQTSRKPDVLKFWFMWKAKGRSGLGEHVDYIYTISDYTTQEISRRSPRFKLILEKYDTPFVSFYYIPPQLRNADQNSPNFIQQMNTYIDLLKNELLKRGIMQTSFSISTRENTPNFFTLNLGNSALTRDDIKYILDQIEYVGSGRRSVIFRPRPPLSPRAYPQFVSAPIEAQHRRFLEDVLELNLNKGIYFQDKRNEPSLNFRTPENLLKIFDFSLNERGERGHDRLIKIFDDVIKYSYHQAHPYWIYQLLTGLDPYTIAADILLATISSPHLTYEDSPIFTLAENEILKTVRERIGWQEGDGTTAPGGSIANIYAIRLALHKRYPDSKNTGTSPLGKKLVYYISKDAHYSLNKGGFFNGIGLENCIGVETYDGGKMNPQALRDAIDKTISEGGEPFFVGTTAGTTILGAFDPFDEIVEICKEFDLWHHIDGAFGGALIMSDSPQRKEKLKGIEKADSFTFNPTKIFGATVTVTCFVIKHKGIVQQALGLNSPIDFGPTSTLYDKPKWDNGDANLQTFRRADLFKFFIMWKAKGTNNMGKHIDYVYGNAEYCVQEMKKREGFVLFIDNFELTNVVFMYVPKRLRGLDKNSKEFKDEMQKVGFEIQARLVLDGIMVIVAQREQNSSLQLKFVLMSSGINKQDVKYIIDQVENYGKDL